MVEKISEGKHDMMFIGIDCVSGCMLIFELAITISEILDKGCELFFDLVADVVLWHFGKTFNLHGA